MQVKQFRPYQADACKAILEAWSKYRSCITVVATGGGKTLIAAGTSRQLILNGRVLYLANRNELCQQPLGVFREQCGLVPGLEKAENKASLSDRVVIGSVQTLSRKARLERFPADHFAYIWADEAHGCVAESWKRIFGHFTGAKICGITATPFRADNKNLTEIFEAEAYRKTLFSLVDEGYLVSPDHVDKLSTAISLANVRIKHTTEGKDYDMQDAAQAIEPYFEEIAKELRARHQGKHILAFLPLVYSSVKFVSACRAFGINAVHVDGEDPQRDEKILAFKRGEITLLSNSNLLHTGVDFPVCDSTLCLRPTRSKVMYQQIVGRSTRTIPGLIDGIENAEDRLRAIRNSSKPLATIIDPMWLSVDHDLVTPSFLVAETQEDAEEINKRAGSSYSLRGLNAQVVRDRTEAMLRQFETAARFRKGKVDAKFFAAAVKDYALLRYEPVYASETKPVSKSTRWHLEKLGIDPDSVSTEGEGRAVVRAIGRRMYKGLSQIRTIGRLIEEGWPLEKLWELTEAQAQAKLRIEVV